LAASDGAPQPGESHEARCLRCGRCCYKKIIIGDTVFYTPFPCRFLDVESRLCKVYGNRHLTNPGCLSVAEGIAKGVFPSDCPYVRDLGDYVPPVEEWNAELFAGALDELVMALDLSDEERDRFFAEAKEAG